MKKIILTRKATENGAEYKTEIEALEASDGYHAFDELYDHRITLFIALCKALLRDGESSYANDQARNIYYRNGNIWRSRLHKDGTMFDGQFILGIRTNPGYQITYHLPLSRWSETDFAFNLETAPEFDGHSSEDVLERLKSL